MPNGAWLRSLRAMEKDTGVDYTDLACRATVLTPYVRDHLSRAAQGIEELYAKLPSAIVSDEDQRAHWEEGREAYVSSICEAIQHLGKALAAVGCTDSELNKLLVCNGEANEVESDTSSDGREEDTSEEETDGSETVVMAVPWKVRATVPESGN